MHTRMQGNASSARASDVATDAVLRALAQAALCVAGLEGPAHRGAGTQPPLLQPQPLLQGPSSSGSQDQGAGRVVGLPSAHVQALRAHVQAFVEEHVLPAEEALEAHAMGNARWTIHPCMEELKARVRVHKFWHICVCARMCSRMPACS